MHLGRRNLLTLVFLFLVQGTSEMLCARTNGEEAVRLLRRYIEIDTTNPPGNEAEGARFLASILDTAGIEYRLLESPAGRTSLYARLPATSPPAGGETSEAVVLTHHIDVVPPGNGWTVPPFSGQTSGGVIWGRGAIDVKSLGIAHLMALARLAGDDAPRRRDLIYLAVADEEAGGREGTGWLLEGHPTLFEGVVGVLGEGGVNRVIGEQVVWWGVEVDQKRPLWLRLSARGRGGHGSTPLLETATHTLVEALARIVPGQPSLRVTPSARAFFTAVAAVEGGVSARHVDRLDQLVAQEKLPGLSPAWLGVLYDSLQITRLEAAESINILAPEAHAWLDIRLLPDTDQATYLADLRKALGPKIDLEILLDAPIVQPSPTDTAVYRTLRETLGVRGPVVPAVIPGITDNRYFRQRGIPAYGWNPFILPGGNHGVHGKDEGIPEDAFLRGVELVVRVVRALVATASPAAPAIAE